MNNDSLSHTKWNCKYHIVFAPKYRRQVIYGKIKKDIGAILRKLCEFKGVEILDLWDNVKFYFIGDKIKAMNLENEIVANTFIHK